MISGSIDILRLGGPKSPSSDVIARIRRFRNTSSEIELICKASRFRDFTREWLPELVGLGIAIRENLANGCLAVLVEKFCLEDIDRQVIDFIYLVIAGHIGIPAVTDVKNQKVIWEVTPRAGLPSEHRPTLSEMDGEAELHTDSAYRIMPERYVALLCLKPAFDGGITTLFSADALFGVLRSMPGGGECEKVLRETMVPFCVPDSFTTTGHAASNELFSGPVFGEHPMVRYRRDSVLDGSRVGTSTNTQQIKQAVDILRGALAQCQPLTLPLRRGDLLIINNHLLLHGRTTFKDTKRLLLRVRIHANQNDADANLACFVKNN